MTFNELIINALEKHVPEVVEDFKLNDKILSALDDITLTDIIEAAVEDSDIEEVIGIVNEIGITKGVEIEVVS